MKRALKHHGLLTLAVWSWGGLHMALAQPPTLSAIALSQRDLGASVLAVVNNASFALSRRDWVAATNDLSVAQDFARELVNHPSPLIALDPAVQKPRAPRNSPSQSTPLTVFALQVQLNNARADLDGRSVANVRADLRVVQTRIPPSAIPSTLPLLSAAAALDAAASAIRSGRSPELVTQLLCAQRMLRQYSATQHFVAARVLAEQIGQAVPRAGRSKLVLGNRLQVWADQICGWAGSDHWGAAQSR